MKIKLLSPVNHDGENHDEGSIIDLKEKDAQALVDAGVATPVGKKSKADEKAEAEAAAQAAADAADAAAQEEAAKAAEEAAKAAEEANK